jgi:hypothetical protein
MMQTKEKGRKLFQASAFLGAIRQNLLGWFAD